MKKLLTKFSILGLAGIVFIPLSCFAILPPSERFILYKNGKKITDFESVVISCSVEESKEDGTIFKMDYCGYSGEINAGRTTIYQVTDNESKKIISPNSLIPPAKDYLVKLNEYYRQLVRRATKSKTIDIKSPDNMRATDEDRYYSVDIDSGEIKYLSGNPSTSVADNVNNRYVVLGLIGFGITLGTLLALYWKFGKKI